MKTYSVAFSPDGEYVAAGVDVLDTPMGAASIPQ